MLITGPLTTRVRDRVLAVWNEIPEPKITVAVGICPISGGVFREGYSIEGPISRYIPVDVNVPGCPPRPQAILEGVVLARKMWLKKLGIESRFVNGLRYTDDALRRGGAVHRSGRYPESGGSHRCGYAPAGQQQTV